MKVPLFHVDSLTDRESRSFHVEGQSVFAVRQGEHIYLYLNRCPHRGIPLEWIEHQFLDSSGSLIQCATHGAQFIPESGYCVTGPCSGQSLQAIAFEQVEGVVTINTQSSRSGGGA